VGTLELAVLVVVSLGAALYVLGERGGGLGGRDAGSRARLRWALAAALAATPLATLLLAPRLAERAPPGLPRVTQRGRFLGSDGCKSCHPGEHASWARTYHRTMTQVARGAALLLPEGAHELSIDDRAVRLVHEGGRLDVTLDDASGERVTREVVMTTGSHHYQAYWMAGARAGELVALPVVWHLEAARLVPRRDVFLQPEGAAPHEVKWGSNCIACHATAGQPMHREGSDTFETEAVELGIACEACHGPGGEHAQSYRDPLARWAARLVGVRARASEPIVDPRRLPRERASEVCGQCHSYSYPVDEAEWWERGTTRTFQPGRPLAEGRILLTHDLLGTPRSPVLDAGRESLFWPDGTIRVGGREHNGLTSSACFTRGVGERRASCLDCHALHGSDPNDQLRPEAKGDGACLGCHEGKATREHTRHAEGQPGSACYDCHMPRVAYALYRAQRSHRIDSPRAPSPAHGRYGRPPACNLCHVDRSLAWTGAELSRGWGVEAAPVDDDDVGLAVRLALSGDAASRVVLADNLASAGVPQGRRRLVAAALAELVGDPYAAVRFVAVRGLEELGVVPPRALDFLVAPASRELERERAWRFVEALPAVEGEPALDYARAIELTGERDDRDVVIAE
jgi:predicted CXXCH cytochrome family protein